MAPSTRADGCPQAIAVVTDALYPYFMGGKEVLYQHVTTGLASRGIDVDVYTMKWWEGPADKTEHDIGYHALCRLYPLYNETRRSILEAAMFSLACLRLISRRYDLIYADHMPHLQLFTIRAVALLRRVPVVVTWHEVWGRDYWREYLGPLGIVASTIERATTHLADEVVAVSAETALQLHQLGVPEERITVIPHGIDLESIVTAPSSAEHLDFLYVGRLLDHKRVEQLIEGVAALRADGTKASCVIVGEGPEEHRLRDLAAQLDLGDQITFISKLEDHQEVYGLMKSARALVLPSVREGFGIVVAEAIACGLPVITTNHLENHAQSLVEDGVTGWLCPATTEGITTALRDAMGPGAERRVPSSEARNRYDWGAVVTQLIDVFARASCS